MAEVEVTGIATEEEKVGGHTDYGEGILHGK